MMSTVLPLVLTEAGLDALVDAQNGDTEEIRIVELGLSDQEVTIAPTLTALPGEFKRLDTLSGESASETIIHMSAVDGSEDVYDVRSIALYLEDGTLFAAYSAGTSLIFRKVDIASFLFSVDVLFSEAVAGDIEFGDATFLYPPATEIRKGVAEIATQDEVDDEEDDERIVTPLKLGVRLTALLGAVNATIGGVSDALAALLARTITGTGLATGGGDLTESRTIDVPAADLAETNAAEIDDKAVVPAGLATIVANIAQLFARTITGGGLVTGGGDLSADRVLTVTAATGNEIATGTEAGKAVTPAAIAAVPQTSAQHLGLGGARIKCGTASTSTPGATGVTFPVAFPTACDSVQITPLGNLDGSDENDEPWWVSSITASGFTINVAGDGSNISFAWTAFGR